MRSFTQFLLIEKGIRQGLPHITTMDHEQFSNLTSGGKVHLHHVTEKTDGMSHVMGYDKGGFYTQYTGSGSERMRSPDDYTTRATRRASETGKPVDLTVAKAMGHVHSVLHGNQALQHHLADRAKASGGETSIRGELLYRPFAKPSSHPGEAKFVGTSYDTSHVGEVGKFIVHSKLPENKGLNLSHFKKLSGKDINFDDDRIHHEPTSIDVSHHLAGMKKVNVDLLKSRTTPKNKAAKTAEVAKFEGVKRQVSDAVDTHIKSLNLSPKWGSESEGLVVHPPGGSKAPRFKVTSDTFRSYRASPAADWKKK